MQSTLAAFVLSISCVAQSNAPSQPALSRRSAPVLTVDGLKFKDLDRNGRLDPYEDWRLPSDVRAHDLVSRLSLEDLAGLMVEAVLPAVGDPSGRGSEYDIDKSSAMIKSEHINAFLTRLNPSPEEFAAAHNHIQEIAEASDFGIPAIISTDPRSHFQYTPGTSVASDSFAKWPETTGLAAIGDPELVRWFADSVRQEYISIGIREALSPQADLATEPRWGRIVGTFGEDPAMAERMVEAYVSGLQNGETGLHPRSVAAVVKHWVGYGAQQNGFDSHNYYGQIAAFSGNTFDQHVLPFIGAFHAKVAMVMPTYSILRGVTIDGKPTEPVGAAFNAQLLNGLLRSKYGFQGVVLTDFAVTNDCDAICQNGFPAGQKPNFAHNAMPWGVETLTKEQRFAKAINAGVDQIGGTDEAHFIVEAVRDRLVSQHRVQEAAFRILLQKFELGLFENPYADPALAAATVGKPEFVQAGEQAQKKALVLLENKKNILPLKADGRKVYLFGIDPAVAARFGFTVVDTPEKADLAIIRAAAPFEIIHPAYPFGNFLHEGRLDFRPGDAAYDALVRASATIPTIVTVYLDRPAILTNVKDRTSALLANFGITDEGLLEVITGKGFPEGHLPFELPSSMRAVEQQRSDLPYDSEHPLYPYGFGLRYMGAGPKDDLQNGR